MTMALVLLAIDLAGLAKDLARDRLAETCTLLAEISDHAGFD
jgi:hypothetical protein